jgi:hypothetical protein
LPGVDAVAQALVGQGQEQPILDSASLAVKLDRFI